MWAYLFEDIEYPDNQNGRNRKIERFKELGLNGWELVSVDNGIAYFKRPTEADRDRMNWISVKDKLPEWPAWVLVYSDGAINCMWYVRGKWSDPTGAQAHNIVMADISHWMPLPDGPTKEEATKKIQPDTGYTYEYDTVQDAYMIFGPDGRKMPGWDVVSLLNKHLESRKRND